MMERKKKKLSPIQIDTKQTTENCQWNYLRLLKSHRNMSLFQTVCWRVSHCVPWKYTLPIILEICVRWPSCLNRLLHVSSSSVHKAENTHGVLFGQNCYCVLGGLREMHVSKIYSWIAPNMTSEKGYSQITKYHFGVESYQHFCCTMREESCLMDS